MNGKMGPNKGFVVESSSQLEEDMLFQEIWEEGLPSHQQGVQHYFVEHESNGEDMPSLALAHDQPLQEDEEENPNIFIQFLRLPHGPPMPKRNTCEPLVDYRQSQILTGNDHVNTLEDIATKKLQIQQKKEERARLRELTKVKRAQEKLKKVQEKEARVAAKVAKKNSMIVGPKRP